MERFPGIAFAPLAWALGIRWADAPTAGSPPGVKLALTEFIAFIRMGAISDYAGIDLAGLCE